MKKYVALRLKTPGFSTLLVRKAVLVFVVLALVTLAATVLSTGVGQMYIHPLNVLKVFLGNGEGSDTLVVMQFRLPRILVSLMIGAGLAVAGTILQGLVRNPLASPDIIGISGGASVAAVAFLTLFDQASIFWLPVAAFLGAALVSLLVYALAWRQGITPLRLVLVGIGIEAATHAVTTLLVVISPIYMTARAVIWMTGSVYGSNWESVYTLLPWLVVFLPLALVLARDINVQELGEDVATGVGSAVGKKRFALLVVCVALAGASVAVGGAIGFVGLLAPHIARKLVGVAYGALIPVSALIGALLVLLADLIARTLFAPLDLPVGIFTACIGAPFFLYLLYKNRNR